MNNDSSPPPVDPTPRERVRAIARRVGVMAEVAAVAAGAFGLWDARAAGRTVSRPAAVAFWAGAVGLAVSLTAPRLRAYVQRRRAKA